MTAQPMQQSGGSAELQQVSRQLSELSERVEEIHKTLHYSNGKEALVVRVSNLEKATEELTDDEGKIKLPAISIDAKMKTAFWGLIVAAIANALGLDIATIMSGGGIPGG